MTSVENEMEVSDLHPADVLLYSRNSALGRAIRILDGTAISHAGMYVAGQVAEAVGEGLLHRGLLESLGTDRRDYIVVCRRNTVLPDASAVVRAAEGYLRGSIRYAYSEVLLCAFLSFTRRVPLTPASRGFIRRTLDKAASILLGVDVQSRPEQLMCSEFVYRCYDEAVAPSGRTWTLKIASAGQTDDVPLEGRGGSGNAGPAGGVGGIRAGSLLDRARDVWQQPILEGRGDGTPAALQPPPAVPQAEVEGAAAVFAAEQGAAPEADPGAPLGDDAADGELLVSMQRFARALADSQRGPQPEGRKQPRGSVPPLRETVSLLANFISPGDLFCSPSLLHLGRLNVPR